MKPRATPLTIPDNPRYWSVTHEQRGVHHFKHPYYGVGAQLSVYLTAGYITEAEGEVLSLQEQFAAVLPRAGALLGLCWYDTHRALTTPAPVGVLTPTILAEYGNAVAEELQDAGYTMLDLSELFALASDGFQERQSLVSQASARADFSAAPKESSTSS